MGRPKIKTMGSDIELEKVKLPEEENELPVLDETAEKLLEKDVKTKAKSKKVKPTKEEKKKPSKRYSEFLKLIDKSKTYSIEEAVELVKKTSKTKFESSIEAHLNLRIDPGKQEQQIRTTATLPKGTGKKIKVLVFGAKDSKAIKDAGAVVGDEDTLVEIEKGKINFDKVVATPEWMPKLAKVAKVLGPKGLMPNPKSGTVSATPEKVVEGLSGGMIEIKTENSPIVHVTIGKANFASKDLEENVKSLIGSVNSAKPSDVKKELIASVYLTSTMGPSVKLDLSSN